MTNEKLWQTYLICGFLYTSDWHLPGPWDNDALLQAPPAWFKPIKNQNPKFSNHAKYAHIHRQLRAWEQLKGAKLPLDQSYPSLLELPSLPHVLVTKVASRSFVLRICVGIWIEIFQPIWNKLGQISWKNSSWLFDLLVNIWEVWPTDVWPTESWPADALK